MNRLSTTAAAVMVLALATPGCSRNRTLPNQLAPSQVTTLAINSYLWRAAIDTVSFAPLLQANPNSGVIITDWYRNPRVPTERVKLTVAVLDPDLRADAIRVSFGTDESFLAWSSNDPQQRKAITAKTTTRLQPEVQLPASRLVRTTTVEEPRITVVWDRASIADVVAGFAAFSGRTIILGKDIKGEVSAEIRNQPWPQAFQAVLASQGLSAQEIDDGSAQSGNSKALAGSHVLVVASRREMRVMIRDALRNMSMLVDFVGSIDEAASFCKEGLPHAIIVDSIQKGSRFTHFREEILDEVPDFVFIEILEQGSTFEMSGTNGAQMARIGRDVVASSLPAALMFELSRGL